MSAECGSVSHWCEQAPTQVACSALTRTHANALAQSASPHTRTQPNEPEKSASPHVANARTTNPCDAHTRCLRARNRQQTGTNLGLPPQGWLPASYLQRSTCRCKGAADESLAEQVHTEMRPWAHQNMGASAVATGDAPVATLFMCAVRLAEQSAYRDAPVATPYMF